MPVQIGPHTTEALEVLIDKRGGFFPSDPELPGEGKRALSVQRGEVDGLRLAPLLGRHVVEGNVEDDCCRLLVDVDPLVERPHQRLIPGEVRQDAQLDLGIVRPVEEVTVGGNESLTNLPTQLGTYRDVLEIWIARRKPPGGRHRLIEAGVDPTRSRKHELGQSVHIGRPQFLQLPIFHHEPRDLVPLRCELLQYRRVRGRARLSPLDHGKSLLLEEDLTQLRCRVQIEFRTGNLVDLVPDERQIALQPFAHRLEERWIDAYAFLLHRHQNRHEGHLHLREESLEPLGCELGGEALGQPECGIDALTRIVPRLFLVDL